MPSQLACRFTTGELAVLRIVADAVRDNGQCVLPVDAIAARAGVCRTTAQNAIRQAAREGLLTVQERRREGRRNDLNIIRIISAEWLTWLKRVGSKKTAPRILGLAISGKRAPDDGSLDPYHPAPAARKRVSARYDRHGSNRR